MVTCNTIHFVVIFHSVALLLFLLPQCNYMQCVYRKEATFWTKFFGCVKEVDAISSDTAINALHLGPQEVATIGRWLLKQVAT